jgi:hypothetical protein
MTDRYEARWRDMDGQRATRYRSNCLAPANSHLTFGSLDKVVATPGLGRSCLVRSPNVGIADIAKLSAPAIMANPVFIALLP